LGLLGQVAAELVPTAPLGADGIAERVIQALPEDQQALARERWHAAREAVRTASLKLAFRAIFGKGWTNKIGELKCRLIAYCFLYQDSMPEFRAIYREWMASASHDELLHFHRVLKKIQDAAKRRDWEIVNPIEQIILQLWVDDKIPLFMIDAPTGAVIVQRILSEKAGETKAVTVENYRKIVKRLGLPHFGKRPLKVTIRRGDTPLVEVK
jgi:hypothetical protein